MTLGKTNANLAIFDDYRRAWRVMIAGRWINEPIVQ